MDTVKMPSEAELMQKLLIPVVETMGLARATAALDFLKPGMEKMSAFKQNPENEQLVVDVLTVVREWSTAILEMTNDKAKAA